MKYCLDCNQSKSDKGLYCKKDGYKHRKRPSGLNYILHKINPTSFKKGNKSWNIGLTYKNPKVSLTNKGKHFSPKTEFHKGNIPFNLGKPHMTNEKHPNWKGDIVGTSALHAWVARKLGKPQKCELCGTTEKRYYDWANKSHRYERNLSDWMRLCRPCHRKYDKGSTERWYSKWLVMR